MSSTRWKRRYSPKAVEVLPHPSEATTATTPSPLVPDPVPDPGERPPDEPDRPEPVVPEPARPSPHPSPAPTPLPPPDRPEPIVPDDPPEPIAPDDPPEPIAPDDPPERPITEIRRDPERPPPPDPTGSSARTGRGRRRRLTMAPLWVVAVMALMAAGCGEESTVGDEGAGDGTTGSGTTGDGTTGEEPADDDAPIGGPYPVADLTIVVTHPEAGDVRYRVVCLGDTATLSGDEVAVDEQAACRALAEPAAVDRLVEGPPADRACTEQFGGHDVATITGTIDEVQVDATVDRTDGCGIDDWDTVLAGLLPPPADVSGS